MAHETRNYKTISGPNIYHIPCHENTNINLLWYYGPTCSFPRALSSDSIDVYRLWDMGVSHLACQIIFLSLVIILLRAAVHMPLSGNTKCTAETWLEMTKIATWLTNMLSNNHQNDSQTESKKIASVI